FSPPPPPKSALKSFSFPGAPLRVSPTPTHWFSPVLSSGCKNYCAKKNQKKKTQKKQTQKHKKQKKKTPQKPRQTLCFHQYFPLIFFFFIRFFLFF
ncbi:hypothetical protein, partial [Helicobacter sp. 'CLO3_human']|uniref:hypothetical protein n=1 Tax=Helicobacter sp. 'CLO3_human' TaxID=2020249 RepID=UPI001F240D91